MGEQNPKKCQMTIPIFFWGNDEPSLTVADIFQMSGGYPPTSGVSFRKNVDFLPNSGYLNEVGAENQE